MAYSYRSRYDYYLVWDSDTIPLNRIVFFDGDGKGLFTMKNEHHAPYFRTINRLFHGEITKTTDKSFIAEHMLINKNCMLNMLKNIENNETLAGEPFYEKNHASDRQER
jgi:hypothetical protein